MFRILKLALGILLLTVVFVTAQEQRRGPVYAQEPYEQRNSFGLFLGLNYNQHSANFTGAEWGEDLIPNCCPRFEKGQGIGLVFGGFYSFPIMPSFDISIRLHYSELNALLSKEENVKVWNSAGEQRDGIFEHTVDAKISSAGIMPLIKFYSTDNLALMAGFRAGVLLGKTFAQKEEITSPSWGGFDASGSRTRHEVSGDIPNASSIDFAAVLGVSYSLPMGKSYEWFIEPEAFYILGLAPLASNLSWNANAISGGISIKYAPRKIIPAIKAPNEAPLPPLPPPPKPPKFNAFITAVSVEADGTESPVSKIRVEEFLSRRIHPLLNYVFFDEGSADIPKKYSRMSEKEKDAFSPNFLANLKTMEVYYQVLNIVGNRMKRFPNTTLNLIGCNSNQGVEAGNLNLSKKRAENVKDFLIKEWGIDPERISVEAKNLPDVPSNATRKEGIEENRRVEMRSDFNEILFEPVAVRDTIRNTNPPILRFKPSASSDVGIKSWKVITYQGDILLKVFEGKGQPPAVLELNLQEEQEYVPLLNQDYKYKLVIVDNSNKEWESDVQSLKVEPYTIQNKFLALMDGEKVDARDYDMFSLISFEFNKSDLTKEHKPILKLAKSRIQDNSKVAIEGRTDNTGDPARNLKLSKERADVTADALGVDQKFSKGLGSDKPFYSNDTPEGRFYNRTVYISIETELQLEDLEK
jgi:outer membrane protein OmpA-like peptidoglycan-associated protein